MPGREYAVVGRIRRAHGIRGEVVVEAITDAPGAIFAPGRRVFAGTVGGAPAVAEGETEPPALTIRSASSFKGGYIVAFDHLPDRNAAELWRDRYLLAPVDELTPPGDDEVYFHELIGMRVELPSGEVVGEVAELYELPQGIALDVRRTSGSVVVPYRPDVVRTVDLDRRALVIDPPEGLLD